MNEPRSTLELAKLRHRGIAATFPRPDMFADLYAPLTSMGVVKPPSALLIRRALDAADPYAACRILTRRGSFEDRASWALFWSVTHASLEMVARGLGVSHEPELNGAYMALLRSSIAGFRPADRGGGVACIIGDHATLGNEARTGADFGMIVEVGSGIGARYVVCLLQAKRATSRSVDVRRAAGNSTQLDRLVASGIGSYLFYHGHDDPRGLAPTVLDAHAVSAADPAHVDPVARAHDFAARLAAAVHLVGRSSPLFALPGFGAAASRDEAARLLFNPNIADIEVNDVLVARVGEAWHGVEAATRFEDEWAAVIAEHREAIARIRDPERHRDDRFERPIDIN